LINDNGQNAVNLRHTTLTRRLEWRGQLVACCWPRLDFARDRCCLHSARRRLLAGTRRSDTALLSPIQIMRIRPRGHSPFWLVSFIMQLRSLVQILCERIRHNSPQARAASHAAPSSFNRPLCAVHMSCDLCRL